jgi:hypothetical protein
MKTRLPTGRRIALWHPRSAGNSILATVESGPHRAVSPSAPLSGRARARLLPRKIPQASSRCRDGGKMGEPAPVLGAEGERPQHRPRRRWKCR